MNSTMYPTVIIKIIREDKYIQRGIEQAHLAGYSKLRRAFLYTHIQAMEEITIIDFIYFHRN